MSKIDPKTRKILVFIKGWLNEPKDKTLREIAKASKVDGATLTRLLDGKNPNYHPKAGTLFRILAEIAGKFPLEIKDNILLSNLPCHGKGEIFNEIAREAAKLRESDVDLVFTCLAILKNREILNPKHFAALTGSMSMLQEELVRIKGPEVFINPINPQGVEINDDLN
jgi:hypothetical protein